MIERKIQLILGSLLHDVGKVVHRGGGSENHVSGGYEWLKSHSKLPEEILRQVKFHHYKDLANAKLDKNDLAYITYIADNISSKMDRKARVTSPVYGRHRAMESVFNVLYGNEGTMTYPGVMLDEKHGVIYPNDEEKKFSPELYSLVIQELEDKLKGTEYDVAYLNSFLELVEALWSFVPSTTEHDRQGDISLYDHAKLTTAFASAIYDLGGVDYKSKYLVDATSFYDKKEFLYIHLDISGIQNFIYNISSEHALKNLRGRSLYLEVLLEYICDELLERLDYSRANLLYSGGGHAYLLSANKEEIIETVNNTLNEVNQWMVDYFGTDLYLSYGYTSCSANELSNVPTGSYHEVFMRLSEEVSLRKMKRYSSKALQALNEKEYGDGIRECKYCHREDLLNGDQCSLCQSTISLSSNILREDFLIVKENSTGISLPWGRYLSTCSEKDIRNELEKNTIIRFYPKNMRYVGKGLTTKLWIADYSSATEFTTLANTSRGMPKLGVLKADVDDLGLAFTTGFNEHGLASISRTSTLSRMLSLFFKQYVNTILEKPEFSLLKSDEGVKEKRKATIVYSGGDDLFIVGAWDDILEFSVDLSESFSKYTQGMMHISAGIGIFNPSYPVHAMADKAGELENCAKENEGKNSISLFTPEFTFTWKRFKENVIEEKLRYLEHNFPGEAGDRGLLYFVLHVLEEKGKLNLARLAYNLSRKGERQDRDLGEVFNTLQEWATKERDARELKAAIILYDYLQRERK